MMTTEAKIEAPSEKGWYWVLTFVHRKLAVRYFSGRHWKFHPGEYRPIRAPFKVLSRIKEPVL